jgi:SAM-dependent methyltransferase
VQFVAMRTPDGHPLNQGYSVVCCTNCACGFADVVVDRSFYDAYYANLAKYSVSSFQLSNLDSVEESHWVAAKADESAQRVSQLIDSSDARILDIGCANGSLLAALGRIGFRNLFGIDPSADSVDIVNRRTGLQAFVGTFASMPGELGLFDCVCLTGVLEHLWDVDEAMDAIIPLLSDSGVIYIEVPDAARYLDVYLAPFEDFSTEHVNHFSFSCLRQISSRYSMVTLSEEAVLVPLTQDQDTAVCSVAWTRGRAEGLIVDRDLELEAELLKYSRRSEEDFSVIAEIVDRGVGGSDHFILWGAGESAFKLLALPALDVRVLDICVDSNPSRHALRFSGEPVSSPMMISPGSVPIVVASLLRANSIVEAIEKMDLPNPVVRLDHWHTGSGMPVGE